MHLLQVKTNNISLKGKVDYHFDESVDGEVWQESEGVIILVDVSRADFHFLISITTTTTTTCWKSAPSSPSGPTTTLSSQVRPAGLYINPQDVDSSIIVLYRSHTGIRLLDAFNRYIFLRPLTYI